MSGQMKRQPPLTEARAQLLAAATREQRRILVEIVDGQCHLNFEPYLVDRQPVLATKVEGPAQLWELAERVGREFAGTAWPPPVVQTYVEGDGFLIVWPSMEVSA